MGRIDLHVCDSCFKLRVPSEPKDDFWEYRIGSVNVYLCHKCSQTLSVSQVKQISKQSDPKGSNPVMLGIAGLVILQEDIEKIRQLFESKIDGPLEI